MSVCDIDFGLELRKANEEGFIEGYDAGIAKVLKDATDEEFKAEAKRRGYNLIKLPEKPRECLFSKRNVEYGYICQLRPFILQANGKPPFVCKDCSKCECLIELEVTND